MTDITITPPVVITVTATSPTAYTITVTQPAAVTVTASLGTTGTVTSIATIAPITGGTITGTGTIGISAATTLAAGSMSASDKSKLDGIEAGAEVNNISDTNATDLTDGGATSLHSHANDHARQHSITSTSDHTSTATSGQMLKADANGLPVNATNTDAEVSAAVTASHAAATVLDTTSIDLTLTGQQISAAAIFGTTSGVVAEGNHTHLSPALVSPSVADNFVSFSNTAGAQKDSGKGLAHLVYTLQYGMSANLNPADVTTYYLGGFGSAVTLVGFQKIYFPSSGTILSVDFCSSIGGTLGSAETSSAWIRVNDTTDTLISNGIKQNLISERFVNSSLGITISAGDFFEIKWTTPTWVTNPTTVRFYGVVLVKS